jgi:hypothetical protein
MTDRDPREAPERFSQLCELIREEYSLNGQDAKDCGLVCDADRLLVRAQVHKGGGSECMLFLNEQMLRQDLRVLARQFYGDVCLGTSAVTRMSAALAKQ